MVNMAKDEVVDINKKKRLEHEYKKKKELVKDKIRIFEIENLKSILTNFLRNKLSDNFDDGDYTTNLSWI